MHTDAEIMTEAVLEVHGTHKGFVGMKQKMSHYHLMTDWIVVMSRDIMLI